MKYRFENVISEVPQNHDFSRDCQSDQEASGRSAGTNFPAPSTSKSQECASGVLDGHALLLGSYGQAGFGGLEKSPFMKFGDVLEYD